MAWETHFGRQYLYRSFRDTDGKVGRKYLGRGSPAVLAAAQLQQKQENEAQAILAVSKMETELAPLAEQIDALERGMRELMEAELLVSGYHLHAGTWRKKRGN